MTNRAFSIGARNVYGGKCALRIAKVAAKFQGIGEIFFVGCRTDAMIHGQLGIHILERLTVVHTWRFAIGTGARPLQTAAKMRDFSEFLCFKRITKNGCGKVKLSRPTFIFPFPNDTPPRARRRFVHLRRQPFSCAAAIQIRPRCGPPIPLHRPKRAAG